MNSLFSKLLGVLAFISIMSLCGEGWSGPLTLTEATGESLEFHAPPERIISLAPSITETVYALGGGDEVVGVTNYCNFPPEVREKEKIGTIIEPNIERIIVLRPDLILATLEGNRREPIENLRRLGQRVFVLGEVHNFGDIFSQINLLGQILNQKERARDLIEKMQSEIKFTRMMIRRRPPVRVFWQYGTNPIVSASKGTFADELIILAGGINIFHDVAIRYPHLSREQIIKRNPEVIIIITMGNVSEAEVGEWNRFSTISAVKNGRLCTIDSELVAQHGPRLVEGLRKVAQCLHPDIFSERKP